MSFTVIEIDQNMAHIRGILQRRLLEVRPGLFVGSVPARIRDELWGLICEDLCKSASAIMILPTTKTESGFSVRTHGSNRRVPIELDGIVLVKYKKKTEVVEKNDQAKSKDLPD